MTPVPPPLLQLDDALEAVRARVVPLPAEQVPLGEAHGRVLAAPIVAARDQPAHDISMMDGYALRARDASRPLRVVAEIAAGAAPIERPLGEGEAARIFTGAPVPPGADCVVMQEQCTRKGDRVQLEKAAAPKPGQHIRRRAEELRAGAPTLAPGTLLGPAELSLAAACGVSAVVAFRRPRVAILNTGDELVPVGKVPGPGQIVETNSLSLAALVREAGGEPILLGVEGDDPARIAARLSAAQADVLLTTGGASVGDHDHAQEALERLGGALVFHRVAIRPGKPILFGVAQGKLLFGLPGNPAAATLGHELFVRLALRLLQGDPFPERARAHAVLRGALSRVKGMTFFPRGRAFFEGATLAFAPGAQQSSMQIASFAGANAVAVLAPGEGKLEEGDLVEVLLLGGFKEA